MSNGHFESSESLSSESASTGPLPDEPVQLEPVQLEPVPLEPVPLEPPAASGSFVPAPPVVAVSSQPAMVSFAQAVRFGFRGYVVWNGRSTRAEYWWWFLFQSLVSLAFALLSFVLVIPLAVSSDSSSSSAAVVGLGMFMVQGLSMLVSLALLLPSLSLMVRRLHDVGRSAWWLLAALVLSAVAFIALTVGVLSVAIAASESLVGQPDVPPAAVVPLVVAGVAFVAAFAVGVALFVFTLLPSTSRPTRWDSGWRPASTQ